MKTNRVLKKIINILIVAVFLLSILFLALGSALYEHQAINSLFIGIGTGLLSSGIITVIIEVKNKLSERQKNIFYILEEIKCIAIESYKDFLLYIGNPLANMPKPSDEEESYSWIRKRCDTVSKESNSTTFKNNEELKFYFKSLIDCDLKVKKILRNKWFFEKFIPSNESRHIHQLEVFNLNYVDYNKKPSIHENHLISIYRYLIYLEELTYIIENEDIPENIPKTLYSKVRDEYIKLQQI